MVSIVDRALYIAQHRRIPERCERHTRRERRRESLCAGSANLVLAQAAKVGLKPRAHGSWVVSIVSLTFYFAQHPAYLSSVRATHDGSAAVSACAPAAPIQFALRLHGKVDATCAR